MDPQHMKDLDDFLGDLNRIIPPLEAEAKSRFLCLEASKLNSWIPRPSIEEINKYLSEKHLPQGCRY